MTPVRLLAAVAALAFLAACSGDGATTPAAAGEDAATAASRFDHVADSVSAESGADAAAPYRAMADVVRQAGAVSTVTLHIGSEDVPFSAVAVSTVISGNVACPIPPVALGTPDGKAPAFCPLAFPVATRTLLAWQPKNPTRLVQLLATSEKSGVGYNPLSLVPLPAGALAFPATLTYNDGAKGFWWATSGNQTNSMTLGSACPAATIDPSKSAAATTTRCTEAKFTWDFTATVAPFPIPVRGNTATGTKTLSMGTSTVNGVQLQITISLPPPPPPSPLRGSLGTKLDGGSLAMTFTVTNAADSAVTVTFPTSQEYDFWVVDRSTGKELWRWSAGRGFFQAIVRKSVAAHGTLSYTESWTPTAHGTVVAHAMLHGMPNATADTTVTLP